MRYLLAVLLVAASAAQAAYVEDVIWLADSTHTLRGVEDVLCCPLDSTIWAGDGDLTIFDAGLTHTLAVVTPVHGIWSMCYNPVDRKVYAADERLDILWIIDAATRTPIDSFHVPADPIRLLYDDARNVVYCVSEVGEVVTVVSGSGDSVIAQVPLGRYPRDACVDTGAHRLYVGSRNSDDVYSIDTRADTIARIIPVSSAGSHAVCNPAEHRAYLGSWASVSVIDTRGDSVLYEMPMDQCAGMVLDPADNKVYASARGALVIFDCATDSVRVESLPIFWGRGPAMAVDTAHHKLYACDDEFPYCWVYDTRGDTLVDLVYLEVEVRLALSANGRVYFATDEGCGLLAIDPTTDEPCASTYRTYGLTALVPGPGNERLYCLSEHSPFAKAIDPATNRLSGGATVAPYPRFLLPVDGGSKLYSGGDFDMKGYWFVSDAATGARHTTHVYDSRCAAQGLDCGWADRAYALMRWASEQTTWVIDTRTDSVIDSLRLGHWRSSCAAPEYDRAYFLHWQGDSLLGVDVATNDVVLEVALGTEGALAYAVGAGRLYVSRPDSDDVLVIDVPGDSVLGVLEGLDDEPRGMVIDEGVGRLFVNCAGSDDVAAVNLATGTIEARIPVGGRPGAIRCDPDSHRVFVNVSSRRMLYVLDGVSLALVDSLFLPVAPYLMAWNPEYQRLYLGTEDFVYAVRLGAGGIEEWRGGRQPVAGAATVVRGVLNVRLGTRSGIGGPMPVMSRAVLLDASGRRVLDLVPGPNDVSHLSPGVYFIRAEGSTGRGSEGSGRKVVIQ